MTICIVILKSLIILLMNILNKLFFKFQNSFRWVEQLVWRKALQMRVENCLLPLIRFPLLSFSLRRVYITTKNQYWYIQFSSVQSLSRVWLFATPWITARQASLSITNSRSSLRFMSIQSVIPSSHLILCRPKFGIYSAVTNFPQCPLCCMRV